MLCCTLFSGTVWRYRFKIINGTGNSSKESTNNSGELHIVRYRIINIVISYDPKYIKKECAYKKCYRKNNNHGMNRVTLNIGIALHSIAVFIFTNQKCYLKFFRSYFYFIKRPSVVLK